ncbi:formate dehydrogenase accessory sulfurtransferase FdhD [Halobacillus salinarum]|uniref:Sulfur carrier protein FdhD n=1 Tax=Halobacillus salinarum TaxID=2932257 RepID=A0ABY4EQY9_9BACI|nr:formate dehydrogenase accessory sulfurtransferase FdhD [Halobacillus salinarum]UOQ46501.1 formate dehydrogenase accessory sulfurtransferase FdhD [Halobacillus salinarum]
MGKGTYTWKISKFQKDQLMETEDVVAVEYPITIHINGEEFATMVCTPLHLEELVVGFLASEGAILKRTDIASLEIDEDAGFAHVELNRSLPDLTQGNKRWIGSCCGKSRAFYFQNDAKTARTVMNHFQIKPGQCFNLMEAFHTQAEMFQKTGGVHQAALATEEGLELVFSDIGRHNALDKLYGYMLLHQLTKRNKLIIFSGRISSEVLLKISKMGIGLLLSKSAPTNLALELAEDLNITAVGFVRKERMNVYTHPERLNMEGQANNREVL